MKSFEDFRNEWLTDEKINGIQKSAEKQMREVGSGDTESRMATFSATFSLLLLSEYHEWIQSQKDES